MAPPAVGLNYPGSWKFGLGSNIFRPYKGQFVLSILIRARDYNLKKTPNWADPKSWGIIPLPKESMNWIIWGCCTSSTFIS